MKLSRLAVVSLVLLILALGSYFWRQGQEGGRDSSRVGERLLEGVSFEEVSFIEIVEGDRKVSLEREAASGHWKLLEREGFFADQEKIRKLILELNKETLEVEVGKGEAQLGALGLLRVEENNNAYEVRKTGTFMRFSDSEKKPLYSLILGNNRMPSSSGSSGYGGQYFRFPESSEAYLLANVIFLDKEPKEWLHRKTFRSFSSQELLKMVVEPQEGKPFTLSRKDKESEWSFEKPQAGKVNQEKARQLASRLKRFSVEDVATEVATKQGMKFEKTKKITLVFNDSTQHELLLASQSTKEGKRLIKIQAQALEGAEKEAVGRVEEVNTFYKDRHFFVEDWEAGNLLKPSKDFFQ